MAAVYVSNIVINVGADFSQIYTLEAFDTNAPLDLTGYEVYSQIRKHAASKNYIPFYTAIPNPLEGVVQIGLDYQQTSLLIPGRYVYDVVVINTFNSTRTRVIEGMALVRDGATKNV